MVVLPEHQPLPVRKHSGSKRERFVAVFCIIQRNNDAGQGPASHGKREVKRSSEESFMVRSPRLIT